MPTGTIVFKCIRINLKRNSTFEPDESCIDSLIEFDLKIGGKSSRGLKAVVRQPNGTDFQSQPLEVGDVIGYQGPWNEEEFKKLAGGITVISSVPPASDLPSIEESVT